MDKIKFLTALDILYKENSKQEHSEYHSGYAKALYDVLQTVDLCKD